MRNKSSKNKDKKLRNIIGAIASILLLLLILCSANTEILNQVSNIAGLDITFEEQEKETISKDEFVSEDNLKVYFIDVGQADSILAINKEETMLIDAGNNEDGEAVVNFIKDKGIEKLNYVVRNPST